MTANQCQSNLYVSFFNFFCLHSINNFNSISEGQTLLRCFSKWRFRNYSHFRHSTRPMRAWEWAFGLSFSKSFILYFLLPTSTNSWVKITNQVQRPTRPPCQPLPTTLETCPWCTFGVRLQTFQPVGLTCRQLLHQWLATVERPCLMAPRGKCGQILTLAWLRNT